MLEFWVSRETDEHGLKERWSCVADQVLKDRNGNRIGSIETRSDGTQIVKDKNGNRRGEYNPKNNTTKDKNGNVYGKGNLLSALITQ